MLTMHNFSLFFFLAYFVQTDMGYEFLSIERGVTCLLSIYKLVTGFFIHKQNGYGLLSNLCTVCYVSSNFSSATEYNVYITLRNLSWLFHPCGFWQINVNGQNQAPLYKYLKSQKGGLLGNGIKWNFTKFLVDKDGKVVERYAPITSPSKIEVIFTLSKSCLFIPGSLSLSRVSIFA
jgi:hypothetical protein